MTPAAAQTSATRFTALTPEQRLIVESGDGPAVVIAGAGTGKTRVIIERVRWLLETKGAGAQDADGRQIPSEPRAVDKDHPFDGPLTPEQVLVLTYNVKAAKELQARLDEAVGPATRSRMSVSNFHSFCNRVLSESAPDAQLPPNPDVLDGVGQVLLLREIRPQIQLIYHSDWWLPQFVAFINRAKDELVTPADFEAFVANERRVFEQRHGPYEPVADRLTAKGTFAAPRKVRMDYAEIRRHERADQRTADARADPTTPTEAFRLDEPPDYDTKAADRTADREARRTIGGTGRALLRSQFDPSQYTQIDALAATYVEDGAALEVMRLTELATVYRTYQTEPLPWRGLT